MCTYWKYLDTVPDGYKFKIKGLNIWDYSWNNTGEKIIVKDPLHGQEHNLCVYEIRKGDLTVKFAAGEFSNCMWGIYKQKTTSMIFRKLCSVLDFNQ